MSKKYTFKEVRQVFEDNGCVLLSDVYTSARDKLKYKCQKGHISEKSFTKFRSSKHKCRKCSSKRDLDIEFMNKSFESKGYKLLSDTYKSNRQKLLYECDKGHVGNIRADHWLEGHGCSICAGNKKLSIGYVKDAFNKVGYTLLSSNYVNSNCHLEYKCDNNHVNKITWNNFNSGHRCPDCKTTSKNTLSDIEQSFRGCGYKLLSDSYINNKQKLMCVCPNDHEYEVSWDNWFTKNSRCPKCSEWGTSYQEKELVSFVSSFGLDVDTNNRDLITPYELDIVIPEKKIAIEYCGLYWHSELAGKDRKYHLNKLNMCDNIGYRLVTVFEDELLYKFNIVKSMLTSLIGYSTNNIVYARKCYIKEIDTVIASAFCNKNHIQGYTGSSIKIGAYFEDTLVSVMTFSKPSIAKGNILDKEGSYEISRFCSKLGYRVVGIASKFVKYFEDNYLCNLLYTYADRRWSDGNLYNKIGMNFVGYTKPNYWYIDKQKRIHRFALRKDDTVPDNVTEWEFRRNQGYNRIWDCGNLKYTKQCA